MISNVIISQFITAFEWPLGSVLAVAVLLVILTCVILVSRLERRRGEQIA